jgi:hypothetical protein
MSVLTRSEKRFAIELISILGSDYNGRKIFGKAILYA